MALTEGKLSEINDILNKMKEEKGIAGGVLRIDGALVKTTLALADVTPMLLSRIHNVADALLRQVGDTQKEVEIKTGEETIVIVRMGNYLFFATTKNKDDKKTILEYAEKIKSVL